MKNLETFIKEEYIIESAAKNVHNPRKGSTLYIMKKGETKAIPVKVTDVTKKKSSWYGKNGYDIWIEVSDNAYGVVDWREPHYSGDFDYSDEKHQIKEIYMNDDKGNGATYYVAVSKEVIQTFIRTKSSKRIEGILKQIDDKQKELDELLKQKQEIEAEINVEITESLNN